MPLLLVVALLVAGNVATIAPLINSPVKELVMVPVIVPSVSTGVSAIFTVAVLAADTVTVVLLLVNPLAVAVTV
jgi:hypothetical protein